LKFLGCLVFEIQIFEIFDIGWPGPEDFYRKKNGGETARVFIGGSHGERMGMGLPLVLLDR
jgi:hypothetical protein